VVAVSLPITVTGLTDILYDDFTELRRARDKEDDALIELVDSLSENALKTPIDYRSTDGTQYKTPPWIIFTTLFNHQTHHRGQVHTMLTQYGIKPPEMDVIYYARENGVE